MPDYDPAALRPSVVHLGLGAFHRTHMAAYIDRTLAADGGWGIVGASLRGDAVRAALAPQDGLYTLIERGDGPPRLRVIGALTEVLATVAPGGPAALSARLAAPSTRVVSLTVTEKGYGRDPASGALNASDPTVAADIAAARDGAGWPRGPLGWLLRGLAARRAAGVPAFTVLSCDNLPANGATLRRLMIDFTAEARPDLAGWIADEVAFPSTMVDRIAPATTDADRVDVARIAGVEDAWPVSAEPFAQFVVEDRFALGRPDWEGAGVEMTTDVAPFEAMKLRMLNGAHSTLAYLGLLTGRATVAEAIGDPALRRFAAEMMGREIAPTLPRADGLDPAAYAAALIARFENPSLRHRLDQIAMDGSQKLPQRLLATVRDRLAAGAPINRLAFAVAGWMRFAGDAAAEGRGLDDPLSGRIIAAADPTTPETLARSLLRVTEVFGDDLPGDPRFADAVAAGLADIDACGVAEALTSRLA